MGFGEGGLTMTRWCFVRRVAAHRRLVLLAAVLLSFFALCVFAIPFGVCTEGPGLSRVKEAIAQQGLRWTPRQYDRVYALGALASKDAVMPAAPEHGARLASLPSSLDWRDHGGNYVSPIKDQGDCGSCWAFAAVGPFESLLAIEAGTPGSFLDLSEQILVSCCDEDRDGCDGGSPYYAAHFLRYDGTHYESCYPYLAIDGDCDWACQNWRDTAFKIAGYESVSRGVESLKGALQYGPFEVAFDIYRDFADEDGSGYGGGVYERVDAWWNTARGGHAVVLVGYEDTPDLYGGGYFIVKNSWGAEWGEEGYFRIGYSQVTNQVQFGKWSWRYYVADAPDAYEPDDSYQEATMILPGESQTHNISPAGDHDWYRFDLAGTTEVLLETSGVSGGDTVMYLYDEGGQNQIAYNDDGGDQYYSRLSLTLPPGTYHVMVCCYFGDEIISSYDLALTVFLETVTVPLQSGWNLVSLPIIPADTNVAAVLGSISGQYSLVMGHDNETKEWLTYDPAVPGQCGLCHIDRRVAFWLRMVGPATLTVEGTSPAVTDQTLWAGWNLAAYPVDEERLLPAAFQSIDGLYTTLMTYSPTESPAWRRYTPAAPSWANNLDRCQPGHGYWLLVAEDCVLYLEN